MGGSETRPYRAKLLPASAGAAATERASASTTEAAPAAAEAPAAKSTAAPASASYAAGDQRANPPSAATAATAPGTAAARHYRVQNENENSQDEKPQQTTGIPLTGVAGPGRRWRSAGELDAAILRDHIRDAASQERDARIIISLAEIRDHLASEATDLAVGEDWFQTLADLRPVRVIIHGKEYQDAAGGLFGADAPLRCYVQGIIFDG